MLFIGQDSQRKWPILNVQDDNSSELYPLRAESNIIDKLPSLTYWGNKPGMNSF